jgi:hypothetical protein
VKISTILDHIDSGHMALPEFQRGYVWNRDQVRGLMSSLYRRHPVGSLLVWVTQSEGAPSRGDGQLAPGVVKLLLDGQQRMTSLYGVLRGKPPRFFDGDAAAFTGLRFHLEREEFAFYSPIKMGDDPRWIDVTQLMTSGPASVMSGIKSAEIDSDQQWVFMERVQKLLDIQNTSLHVEEVSGQDKTVDVVVDIFNRVNSGGTKLSKGDLALAKVCASLPDARREMKESLATWREAGFHFNLDWLLRNVNTVTTGEARFQALHDVAPQDFLHGLKHSRKHIDTLLNLIGGRFGLDHGRVLFGLYAFPVMTHYLERRGGKLSDDKERDRLLFWYLQAAMWGRFSGSTETLINRDLELLEDIDQGLSRLLEELRLWRGSLWVEPEHFAGWSLAARFYPVLYLLTRVLDARDWGNGLPLKHNLHGKMNQLEVHHVFPKARLYASGFSKSQVNAVANYCFLTKETNLHISDRDPATYLAEVESKHPGALASQWIPMDRELWSVDRYPDFLAARKELLANAANTFLAELLHGDDELLGASRSPGPVEANIPGGVESGDEERALLELRDWVTARGLPEGRYLHELLDDADRPVAVLDLAWPDGLQVGLSRPVAVLLDETSDVIAAANRAGYLVFTSPSRFQQHVDRDVLNHADAAE